MTVSRDQVRRAYRVGDMRCESVKVLPSIFTKHESFRVKVWNRSDELAIHELDSMYWCQISRPLSATRCDSRQWSSFTQFDLVAARVIEKIVSLLARFCEGPFLAEPGRWSQHSILPC